MNIKEFFQLNKTKLNSEYFHWLLFFSILGLGIFARAWQFKDCRLASIQTKHQLVLMHSIYFNME